MKPCLCFLVVAVALVSPAVAHFWPPAHPFHSVPNETMEPATYYANVVPPNVAQPPQTQAHAFLPSRFWKSDSAFFFRPFMTSAWAAAPEQRMPLHNPFMDRLISSAYRRPSFGNYFKDSSSEGFGKRSRRRVRGVRGMRGEINVKWAVMPIWRREHKPADSNNAVQSGDGLPRPNRELLTQGPHHWPSMSSMHPMPPNEQQAAWSEGGPLADVQENTNRRKRRQIGFNWNPQPLFNKFLSNATGLFDNLGRQMTRQLQSSVTDASKAMNGMFSGAFSSMDNAVRRFINLNVGQLRPDKLFSQIAALTRAQ